MALKILYLDDEPELCEAFVDNFGSPDILITTCTDAQTASDVFAKNKFDLIFFDYRLPGTTGDLLAQALKPTCPTYLITGEISVQTQFPFTKVFPKPFIMRELESIIQEHLTAHNG